MCKVGEFNRSQASLTSPEALAALRDLPNTDPDLYQELTSQSRDPVDDVQEDLFNDEDHDYCDESDVPVEVLIDHVISAGVAPLPAGFAATEDGSLARSGSAEDTELDVNADDLPVATRRAKRSGKKNTLYAGAVWEEH
ncbi:hypothetical protein R3P38DRAFT_2811639 [Favolaschia claudopus]